MANRSPDSSEVRVPFIHTEAFPLLGANTWIHSPIIRNRDRNQHVPERLAKDVARIYDQPLGRS